MYINESQEKLGHGAEGGRGLVAILSYRGTFESVCYNGLFCSFIVLQHLLMGFNIQSDNFFIHWCFGGVPVNVRLVD